jgi:LCP family protein required for cell wall assembly
MTRLTSRRVVHVVAVGIAALVLACSTLVTMWVAGIRVPLASGARWMTIQKVASAEASGGPDAPFFMLLVGSDLRPGVGGARGDALHLVGVNPRLRRATILNFPRDTCWRGGKINRAHAEGGPRGQATAVGELAGVPVSYVVSVDFAGFQALVDGAGGVVVDVQTPMSDSFSGAYFQPGRIRMNSAQALAFSRDRHDFPRGDITRSDNQGALIVSALGQLQEEARGAAGELRLLALLGRHAQLDGVGLADLYRLGRIAHRLDPTRVRNAGIPIGGGGCLSLTGAAPGFFADFRDDGVLQAH